MPGFRGLSGTCNVSCGLLERCHAAGRLECIFGGECAARALTSAGCHLGRWRGKQSPRPSHQAIPDQTHPFLACRRDGAEAVEQFEILAQTRSRTDLEVDQIRDHRPAPLQTTLQRAAYGRLRLREPSSPCCGPDHFFGVDRILVGAARFLFQKGIQCSDF